MILISGVVTVEPDDRARALELTRALAAASREEPGCRAYGFWEDPDEQGRFRVFEEWESAQALEAHFATPHIAAFLSELPSLRITGQELTRYEVANAAPLGV